MVNGIKCSLIISEILAGIYFEDKRGSLLVYFQKRNKINSKVIGSCGLQSQRNYELPLCKYYKLSLSNLSLGGSRLKSKHSKPNKEIIKVYG